jgi:hypothetical protein
VGCIHFGLLLEAITVRRGSVEAADTVIFWQVTFVKEKIWVECVSCPHNRLRITISIVF